MRRITVIPIIFCIVVSAFLSIAWAEDSFSWPVAGDVLTGFASSQHRGIDIAASVGEPVAAAQDGVVYWVGRTPRGEPCVSIDHPSGLSTTYLPVTASVSEGQSVSAGEPIGTLSPDGDISSEQTHLHFGVFETASRNNKRYVNPLGYLPAIGGSNASREQDTLAAERVSPGGAAPEISGAPLATATAPAEEPATAAVPEPQVAAVEAKVTDVAGDTHAAAVLPAPQRAQILMSPPTRTEPAGDMTLAHTPSTERAAHIPSSGASAPALYGVDGMHLPQDTAQAASTRLTQGDGLEPQDGLPLRRNTYEEPKAAQRTAASVASGAGVAVSRRSAAQGMTVPAGSTAQSANPFIGSVHKGGSSMPSNAAPEGVRDSTGSTADPALVRALLRWEHLPDMLTALTVAAVATLSVNFMRRAKRLCAAGITLQGSCA